METLNWLARWLRRHPLKEPAGHDRTRYTAEVMARVRALEEPVRSVAPIRWRLSWPRAALTFATACAGVVIAIGLSRRAGVSATERLVEQATRDAQVLTAMSSPGAEEWWTLTALSDDSASLDDLDGLAEELQLMDTFRLVQQPPSDEDWLEQTLLLLEQLDEDLPQAELEEPSVEEWWQELDGLDELEGSASS
jgi:hypothetical protein